MNKDDKVAHIDKRSEECLNYSNYETAMIALDMDNTRENHDRQAVWNKEAWENAKTDATFPRLESAGLTLMETLKNHYEESNPFEHLKGLGRGDTGVFPALMSGALSRVNWYEIAKTELEEFILQNGEKDQK